MNGLGTTSNTQNDIPSAKHIVCFWKHNDLGLFGRRPDRWIEYWNQDPKVEKILVFEPPMEQEQLRNMLSLSMTLDTTSASEYALLLAQAVKKHQGLLDGQKLCYKTYVAHEKDRGDHHTYLRWMTRTLQDASLDRPLVVMWPPCFTHLSVVRDLNPGLVVTDLVDDPRSTPGQGRLPEPIEKQYRGFFNVSHRILSPSRRLIRSLSTYFDQAIEHLPNARLNHAHSNRLRTAPVTPKKAHPVVGYVGNLREINNPQPLLHSLRQHEDKQFWFIGQTHGAPLYMHAKMLPNCRFFGTLPQDRIQKVLPALDAIIIPYKNIPMPDLQEGHHAVIHNGRLPMIHLQGLNATAFSDALTSALKRPS